MHELSIVDALIEQARNEIEQSGQTGRALRLDLVIGRLAGVNCDSVRFAFELLAPGTRLEGAQIHITQPKATCCCRACGAQTEIDDLVIDCPRCASTNVFIEGGRELMLESLEIGD